MTILQGRRCLAGILMAANLLFTRILNSSIFMLILLYKLVTAKILCTANPKIVRPIF